MPKRKQNLESLLKANPKARRQEQAIREALRLVRRVRSAGVGDEGYELLPPFGEKAVFLQKPKAETA